MTSQQTVFPGLCPFLQRGIKDLFALLGARSLLLSRGLDYSFLFSLSKRMHERTLKKKGKSFGPFLFLGLVVFDTVYFLRTILITFTPVNSIH